MTLWRTNDVVTSSWRWRYHDVVTLSWCCDIITTLWHHNDVIVKSSEVIMSWCYLHHVITSLALVFLYFGLSPSPPVPLLWLHPFIKSSSVGLQVSEICEKQSEWRKMRSPSSPFCHVSVIFRVLSMIFHQPKIFLDLFWWERSQNDRNWPLG